MAYNKVQATHEFTRWSESYDRSILQWLLFAPSHRALTRRIREIAGEESVRILDVGCGTGVFASRVRSTFPNAQVWGIDLVAGMLDKGQARWGRHREHVLPVQGDSERLPFANDTFDILTCANSFHHYPHQDRAVTEMYRVLKPGGRLLLIDGYRDRLWGWFIYDVCVAGVEGDVHHASARRFRNLFDAAGFQSIAQRIFPGPAPFLLNEGVAGPSAVVGTPHFRAAATPAPNRKSA